MDEYYRILESLPPALRTPLAKLDAHYAPHIQEIRLRLGQPVQFTICGRKSSKIFSSSCALIVRPFAGKPTSNLTISNFSVNSTAVRRITSGPGLLVEINPLFPEPFALKLY